MDYEARQTYILIVQAKDNGKPSKTGSARVTVNIQDQNDNKPVFDKNPYRLTLSESASTDYEIGQVRATDRDSGQNAALSYLTDTTGIPITITSDGKVKVTGSLDRETKDIYQLTAKVKDGGSPARESTSQVIVTVLDANDNAPIITNSPIKTEVLENSPSSTLAVFIVASDADIGNNAKLSYSLSPASGSNFPFRIESVSIILNVYFLLVVEWW